MVKKMSRQRESRFIDFLAKLSGISGYSLYGVLRNPLDAFLRYPYQRTKWFFQRAIRGYSDRDNWDISGYLNSWLPQAIDELRWSKHGYPVGLKCQCYWDKILITISEGFKANKKVMDLDFDIRTEKGRQELKKARKTAKKGLLMFVKYYNSLWD